MIASDTVLLRAQGVVSRALKSLPFAIRAALPVDPDDPPDMRLWLTRTLNTAKPGCFCGPPATVVRRLRWTALDAARRARRRLPRGRDDHVLQLPDASALDGVLDRLPPKKEWEEALENLAVDAASAAGSIVARAKPGLRRRKALAVLACLARSIAAVRADEGTTIAAVYVQQLVLDPAFLSLPLETPRRLQFRNAMSTLTDATVVPGPPEVRTNLRRTLHAVAEPWAQPRQWQEFAEAFDRQRRLRMAAQLPPRSGP